MSSAISADLLAAAATVDLDPPEGVWMSGFGARLGPSIGQHDPILARAVVLSSGTCQTAIATVDCVGLSLATVARVRADLAVEGFSPSCVLLSATHTHSGPATMPFRGVMGRIDPGWLARAESRIVSLVAGLRDRLRPVSMRLGSTALSGIGFNRQDQRWSTDEELLAIQFRGICGEPVATLLNYATHPVILGPENRMLSAEFPGVACQTVESRVGGVALYLQGACGDVNPIVTLERGSQETGFDDVQRCGQRVGEASVCAAAASKPVQGVPIGGRLVAVELALQSIDRLGPLEELRSSLEARLSEARNENDAVGESFASAMLEWHEDLSAKVERGERLDVIEAELQAIRIGDLVLLALPFEPYTEVGLRIKQALMPVPTVVCGYSNGLYGYCATDAARDQGGYGPDGSHRWFPLLPLPLDYGSDSVLVERAVALARSLLG